MKKNNQEILNDFGKILIKESFDNQLRFIKNSIDDLAETEDYKNLFTNMSVIQKREIEKYTIEILKGQLFDFLRIFEENPEYKIYFETGEQKVNLVEASEMLKAEAIIENGWIKRFSKELDI
jgi:hypothetical protein